jgi:hypothetical protein
LKKFRRLAPNTGVVGGSKEEKSLEEEHQGGHDPKKGTGTIEGEEDIKYVNITYLQRYSVTRKADNKLLCEGL